MAELSPLSTLKRMALGAAQQATPSMLGRFELRRMLGQGAQSQVWLAFDPRLEREVAIKLMKPMRGSDASAIGQWLQEARSVSRLTHPHIVPVFEADVHEQQPYLVFEYVAGQTLTDLLAKDGALEPAKAVKLMQEILSALVVAHAQGVVHRDLKPSNVLLDASGRARVMDFGIAVRLNQDSKKQEPSDTAGTPAYMSPEAARGEAVSAQMDVYSAGLLLAQALLGKPLIEGADPYRVIYRVAHEALTLPPAFLESLDDALRAILLHALAFEAKQRYLSAQLFLDALTAWMTAEQEATGQNGAQGSGQSGTLEFLLRRMQHKSDFPALSESIVHIQSMAASDKESVSSVTNEILKNVALTNKLLRLVNSAHYARGNKIGTVSRAVTLVGFNGIRNMALSLVLLEHMQDKTNAQFLKEEFVRALMAASIASELGRSSGFEEEAFIGALFQNLGRMLSQFYFAEEAAAIRKLVSSKTDPVSEDAASTRILGMSYEALGLGISKAWGLPESIQRCMHKPAGEPPTRPSIDQQEQMRWVACAANDMTQDMLHADAAIVERQLAQTAKRYSKTLATNPAAIQSASACARTKLVELAKAMDLSVPVHSSVAHLLHDTTDENTQQDAASSKPDELQGNELHATHLVLAKPMAPSQQRSEEASQTLTAGIQDITNVMVEDFKLSDVLRMILEAMFRALDFHRVIFCMRDVKTDMLTGRFGLGAGVEGVVKSFCVPLRMPLKPDLFSAVCNKGADTLISDASDPRILASLPAWYRQSFNAPTFLILPLLLKGKPFGLIYADKAEKGGLTVDEKELALLRTLRNQAVMAFKQSN
jgi:serine/threonine protein kinase